MLPTQADMLDVAAAAQGAPPGQEARRAFDVVADKGWTDEELRGGIALACCLVASMAESLNRFTGGRCLEEMALGAQIDDIDVGPL